MSLDRAFRILSGAAVGPAIALACASAAAQTTVGVGSPIGTPGVLGPPGSVYNATGASNLGIGSASTPGVGIGAPGFTPGSVYGTASPVNWGIGAAGSPGLVTGGTGLPIGVGYVSTPSTAAIGAVTTTGVGSGGAIQWFAPGTTVVKAPRATIGAVPTPGAGFAAPELPYGEDLVSPWIGEIEGIPGLFP